MLELTMILTFITVTLLLYPILKVLVGNQKSISRLRRYTNVEEIREEKRRAPQREYKAGLNLIAKTVGNARILDGYKKSIQQQLNRAHVLLKAEEYITICIILFIGFGLLVFSLSSSQPLANCLMYTLGAAIIGWLIPAIILKTKIKKRIRYLNEQLGDAIILISNSLKAGYSFFQSVDIVVKEMTGPISEEFALLQKEVNLGVTTEKALENLVSRVSSDDLELVVTAVLIQRQVGGNLAEVLDNISSTIRERVRIKGEVKTVTAQGRMSGLIIALLPPILGLILFVINPEHIKLLITNPLGLLILIFSVLMELIGIYFISKIVKIEI
ncbi:MAG: type II secretion system F family protein [Clostridia bacterium]|nr:type II secretion system F family protein [Clostridia bacterium]